jgi:hypothetical protein
MPNSTAAITGCLIEGAQGLRRESVEGAVKGLMARQAPPVKTPSRIYRYSYRCRVHATWPRKALHCPGDV